MATAQFKSGPWVGFYTYLGSGQKHLMDLNLRFSSGKIHGDGADGINTFSINGHYDARSMECGWKKIYPAHTVHYQGFQEGKGIWGRWEINYSKGGFHIWPLTDGAPRDLRQVEEEALAEKIATAPLIIR